MPITKSAKKAIKVAKRRQSENLLMKQEIKNRAKTVRLSVSGDKKDLSKEIAAAYSALDKAAKKKFIHKNKASRLKSRLAKTVLSKGISLGSETKKPSATTKKTKK